MSFIGIDIGTTRTKALLYDAESGTNAIVSEATPVVATALGDFRDPDAVVAVVLDCIGRLVADLSPSERERVGGIGVTSLGEEMVMLDNGGKSMGAMPAWHTVVGADRALARGMDPSLSWSKLAWAFEQIDSGESRVIDGLAGFASRSLGDVASVTTLNGFVAGNLGSATDYPIDHSHASRTGFFDVRAGTWQSDVFEETGWPTELLPALVPAGASVSTIDGELAVRWGISPTASVVLAGHDHFCGAYAIGVRGEGQLYISAGTSEAHCLVVDALPGGPMPANVGIGRFVDGERFYLHRQLPSGHLYRQWTSLLGLDSDESKRQESERLHAEPLGSRGTMVLPGLDTDTRSSLVNLDPAATPHTILRALLEGLACAALHIDRELVELTHRPIVGAVASGIPCLNPLWQELRSQLAVAPLAISEQDEAPALGAALLCQRAVLGVETAPAAARPVPVEPGRASEYEALFARYESVRSR
jgi:xylulokinase